LSELETLRRIIRKKFDQGKRLALSYGIAIQEKRLYTMLIMSTNLPRKKATLPIWKRPKYALRRIWTELYSRYQENFNPEWHKLLPPPKCELCGKLGHLEAYCPNAKGLGFLD
jgi:hypothetical protein